MTATDTVVTNAFRLGVRLGLKDEILSHWPMNNVTNAFRLGVRLGLSLELEVPR